MKTGVWAAISSKSEHGYWSNEQGWVFSVEDATWFRVADLSRRPVNLPLTSGNDAVLVEAVGATAFDHRLAKTG